MNVIDNILLEWSYRCPDGIVDMNDPKKVKILFEILKPMLKEDIDDDILNLLSNKDVPTKEKILTYLQNLDKGESEEEVKQFKKEEPKFYKEFFKKSNELIKDKNLDKKITNHILGEFLAEDKEEYLIKYFRNEPKFNAENIVDTLSIKNPVYDRFKDVGCEGCEQIIDNLYSTLAGSAKTRGVSKEENFLAAFYSNVKKREKAGDLEIDGKKYEIKGVTSVVSPYGYGVKTDTDPILNGLIENIKNNFKDIYRNNEEDIKKITKGGEKWVSSIVNIGNKYFSEDIRKYLDILEKSLEIKYKNIKLENVLENNLISDNLVAIKIAQNCIDNASLEEGEQFLFVNENGESKIVPNKEELKKLINNGINITGFSDLSPRLTYNGQNTFATKEPKEKVSKEPKEDKPKISQEIQKLISNIDFKKGLGNKIVVKATQVDNEIAKKLIDKNFFEKSTINVGGKENYYVVSSKYTDKITIKEIEAE